MTERKTPRGQKADDTAPAESGAETMDLEARERALAEREEALAAREAALAPREREAQQNTRSRALDDTRRKERQSMDFYAPPSQLEVPDDPEYHYRWIMEYVNGSAIPRNVQQRLREGYVRVRMDELPEDFLVDEDRAGDGYARTGGLILMRIPKARKAARDEYYRRRSLERVNAVDELQGVAGRDAVREDRGSRALTGAEAQRALSTMSQT